MTGNNKTRVKTAKGRKTSSANWLRRQLNDEYTIKAKEMKYRSRAIFKFQEIDKKFQLIKQNCNIVDLGAAPGGWSQYCTNLSSRNLNIIAVDLLLMEPVRNVDFLQGDFSDIAVQHKITDKLQDGKADLILSDMSPNTTGNKQLDHLRIIALCEEVLDFAVKTLKPGGNLVCKIFRGGLQKDLSDKVNRYFTKSKSFKPKSSHSDSVEIYLIAQEFKGE